MMRQDETGEREGVDGALTSSRALSLNAWTPSIKHSLRSPLADSQDSQAQASTVKGNGHFEAVLQKSERGVRGSAHPYHLIPVIPITSSRRNAEFVEGS